MFVRGELLYSCCKGDFISLVPGYFLNPGTRLRVWAKTNAGKDGAYNGDEVDENIGAKCKVRPLFVEN